LGILIAVVGGQDPQDSETSEQAPASTEPERGVALNALRSEAPAGLRDVSFPHSVRGYERRAVDAYVERANRVIAELEVSRSPQSAVKHALDRVGEQTSGVLQRAREVAEEITSTALAEAEETTTKARTEADELLEDARMNAHQLRGEAKQEADQIVAQAHEQATERLRRLQDELAAAQAQAERRLAELQAQTDAAADARRRLLEDLRRTAHELERVAGGAADVEERGAQDGSAGVEQQPTPGDQERGGEH
jgi:cell division septum initiation protein DivIVA